MVMRIVKTVCSIAMAFVMAITFMPHVAASANAQEQDAVRTQGQATDSTGEIIVVFDSDTTNKKINEVFKDADADAEAADITKIGDEKIVLADIDAEADEDKAIAEMNASDEVLFAQPNYVYRVNGEDPYYSDKKSKRYQYHLDQINAKEAWKIVEANKKQKTLVAIVDTGVDINHEDLKGRIKSYKQIVAGRIVDGKADTGSHGTHVTGILGATNGNGKGGAGVASGTNNDLCDIMVVANSEDGETMTTYNTLMAVKYAVDHGAKIINMSYGGDVRDRINNALIKEAYHKKGVVFVGAAGNDGSDMYSDPSDLPEVISVCNNDEKGYMEELTNYGWTKDISAPGTNITSTFPNDMYVKYTGTSMASPVVAGVCALMLDVNPSLNPGQVRNIICATSIDKPDGAGTGYYKNNGLGYGRIDAQAAVKAACAPATNRVDSLIIKKDNDMPILAIEVENPSSSIYGDHRTSIDDEGTGLEALMMPANTGAKINWQSADPSVATVDEYGVVRGITAGESTTITASAGGKTDSIKVQVVQSVDATDISIDLDESEKTMFLGESSWRLATSVSMLPKGVTNSEVYWTSSDTSVLTVDDMGYMTARKVGKATVTVSTYNGKKASVDITVIEPPAKVRITKSTTWVRMGEKATFAGEALDAGGSKMKGYDVTFSSGNKTIASVSKNGKFVPKKAGNVYVFATAKWNGEEGGEVSAYKKVVVTKKNYKGKDYALKCKSRSAKKIKLSWKKIPMNSGYVLMKATKKNGKYKAIAKLKKGRTTYTDKKVKKGRTYYYKIRASYRKNGKSGKYSYSNVAKIKARNVKKTKNK